jgi:hypothetical protein
LKIKVFKYFKLMDKNITNYSNFEDFDGASVLDLYKEIQKN